MDVNDVQVFGVKRCIARFKSLSSLRQHIKAKPATENPYSIGKDGQKKRKKILRLNMVSLHSITLKLAGLSALISVSLGAPVEHADHFDLKPFSVNLSKGVPRMLELIKDTKLPDKEEYPGVGSSAGIGLDVVKSLQREWTVDFDWHKEEAKLNK